MGKDWWEGDEEEVEKEAGESSLKTWGETASVRKEEAARHTRTHAHARMHSQSVGFSLPVCVTHLALPLSLWSPPTPPTAKNGASLARD